MAIFKARAAADMTEFKPYRPLGDWRNISIELPKADGPARYFEATLNADPNVVYHVFGDWMDVTPTEVNIGWIMAIEVWDDRFAKTDPAYVLSGLNINAEKFTDAFRGDFAPRLFNGADDVTGSNQADLLRGYGGRDSLAGGEGGDTIHGDDGGDGIEGNAGDDILRGGAGNDELDGGFGRDKLFGGGGKDFFVFDGRAALSSSDTIADFKPAADTIQLDAAVFAGLGRAGVLDPGAFVVGGNGPAGKACIIYDAARGDLFYKDASGARTKFAGLDPGLALDNRDFFLV